MIIEEYDAKSLVRTARTSLFSWAEVYLNPYQGCEHDCVYCDGKAESYYMHDDFGQRIRVKKNAPELLELYFKKQGFFPVNREKTSTLIDYFPNLRESADSSKKKKFVLFIGGGVCDVYQPAEKEVKMTRKLLQIAYDYKIPVFFLTKNTLILRDLDLLKKINEESYACASFTITLTDEKKQKIFEPNASTSQERFEAVEKLRDEGIHSGIYFYPTLPFIGDTEENMNSIYKTGKGVGAEFIYCWGLTLKPGRNKNQFMKALQDHFSEYYQKYKELYGNEDKYGNLDSKKFEELGLIWPEIRGYKLGYELKIDYTSKRYVPEGRIETNLIIAEVLHRLAYLKSFFIKSSKYETRQLNLTAKYLNSFSKDISEMSDEVRRKLDIDKVVVPYIEEYLQEKRSKTLKSIEEEAYTSVSRYLKQKELKC
ncbi:MAG: radical SAM protein [Candidatus Heimdallarchaeota archaeon]|nr:MAG: radical SAM protein [Candidatus Heimdallarchaeota archaeon]